MQPLIKFAMICQIQIVIETQHPLDFESTWYSTGYFINTFE